MTENFYIVRKNNSIYSGDLSINDFNTYEPNMGRSQKQIEADNLEKTIKDKVKKISEEKKFKNMTLEELKELRLISNTNGRPTSTMTDEKWQKEFNLRKLFIEPYPRDIKKMKGKFSKESEKWNEETQGTYDGCTSWQQYCTYINDILSNIRSGQVDYCYYIYQIMDLLKFHHDTLRTRYCDGYWTVWLER